MEYATSTESRELQQLCDTIRTLLPEGEYKKCEELIAEAMGKYPDAAQPHNLFGLLLEREGDHASAMKHFRAARALDPTYQPARQNLEHYGTFYSSGTVAYDESDCRQNKQREVQVVYDAQGVGHVEWKS